MPRSEDGPKFMTECFLIDGIGKHSFQFGPHAYHGRPVKSWGGIMICDSCESANHDGVVLEHHPNLLAHLVKIGAPMARNEKGWLPIPQ